MDLEKLRTLIESEGHEEYGFASLKTPISLEFYKTWIQEGLHGEMAYLERHIKVKEKPELKYPRAESAIVFRFHYYPTDKNQGFPLQELPVALYARRKDYHEELKEKIQPLIMKLQAEFPGEEFLFHTDSSPILERDLAYRAGLGWFGKNTCLIDQKKGSLFFIAEILTSLKLNSAEVLHPDRCGNCTRCIDACPTQALSENKKLDANRCISYLNIEKKGLPHEGLRPLMGAWFFGCDICQTVCPWNEKVYGKKKMQQLSSQKTSRKALTHEISMILRSSDLEIKEIFRGTPLLRSKAKGLKRNAIIVATNCGLKELKEEISPYLNNSDLSELANWSLERL